MKRSMISLVVMLALLTSACNFQFSTSPSPNATLPAEEATVMATAVVSSAPLTSTAPLTDTTPVTDTTAVTASTTLTDAPTLTATATPSATTMLTTTDSATETSAVTATNMLTGTGTMTDTGMMTSTITLPDTSEMTIGEIVRSLESFSTLAVAVEAAGLGAALDAPGPLTVFAPANAAFSAVPTATLQSLLADPVLLADVLQYHIVIDAADRAELARLNAAQSTSGQPLIITLGTAGELFVNEAQVVYADIPASNGTIHVINGVLTPPGSGLSLPTAAPGAVALMSTTPDTTLEALAAADTSGQTIVEILNSISGLSTTSAAIGGAGLTTVLQQAGPFTLFVPNNGAFDNLPSDQLTALINDSADMAAVLRYHLVLDEVTSADLATLPSLLTASGATLAVTVQEDGEIFINSAPVFQADIEASNGVIHIVGELITPLP